jgi:eukaryotic-like serine/threonine-protein kinase
VAELQEALGREYEIKQELGKGSMARVYLARDRGLGRLVAIKVLLPGQAADETARKRFEREAKASASFSHPNVVEVYRFGRLPDETPYLVMRFVKGRTLEERLAAEGPLDPAEARTILRQVASGLAAAHAQGIVHRDVRPNNVLWDEERGEALLSDFGIAAILATSGQDVTRLTLAGHVLGDPRYQSPEQLLDQGVTELTDIYAFGITGYQLLTGEGPYEARTSAQLISAHLGGEPRDLRALRPEVDADLADLLRRCLAREPKHRPSARDIARALDPAGSEGTSGAVATLPSGDTDIRELIRRRVPQIVLIAIAVAWGVMEFVGQLAEQDVIPGVFYRLTLPFAACGVAASAVVGWFHGERGKQQASLLEYLLLAVIASVWVAASALIWLAD